ncbi:MAG: hypothetical protein ACPG32_11960, partial [Akkermansiaceae bacterium]
MGHLFRFLLLLVLVIPASGDVWISEFMASNDDTLDDQDGDSTDWIELYNDGKMEESKRYLNLSLNSAVDSYTKAQALFRMGEITHN